jgi:hypothetical protein
MAPGAAVELAWAKALAPKPDARMHTTVNERFMRFYNSFILLDWDARIERKRTSLPGQSPARFLGMFFDRRAKNAEKRHGQRTFTGTHYIIGGRSV